MTEWGIHRDVFDNLLADAYDPAGVMAVVIEEMKREVIRAIMDHDATLFEADMNGESKIEIISSHYRHHVPPYDEESVDGDGNIVIYHRKGYECTRLEVYARTLEEDS